MAVVGVVVALVVVVVVVVVVLALPAGHSAMIDTGVVVVIKVAGHPPAPPRLSPRRPTQDLQGVCCLFLRLSRM